MGFSASGPYRGCWCWCSERGWRKGRCAGRRRGAPACCWVAKLHRKPKPSGKGGPPPPPPRPAAGPPPSQLEQAGGCSSASKPRRSVMAKPLERKPPPVGPPKRAFSWPQALLGASALPLALPSESSSRPVMLPPPVGKGEEVLGPELYIPRSSAPGSNQRGNVGSDGEGGRGRARGAATGSQSRIINCHLFARNPITLFSPPLPAPLAARTDFTPRRSRSEQGPSGFGGGRSASSPTLRLCGKAGRARSRPKHEALGTQGLRVTPRHWPLAALDRFTRLNRFHSRSFLHKE